MNQTPEPIRNYIQPTPSGGRLIVGDKSLGEWTLEALESFIDGSIIVDGRVVGTATVTIKTAAIRQPSRPCDPPHTTIAQKIKGAAGLLKAERGKDRADDRTIAARQFICEGCEDHFDFGRCTGSGGCACYLWAKVRIASEACPLTKWGKVPPVTRQATQAGPDQESSSSTLV